MNAQVIEWAREELASLTVSRMTRAGGGVSRADADAVDGVTHDVITENNIVNCAAWTFSKLVLGIKQDRSSFLRLGPIVLKNVAFHQFPDSHLVLEQVLDCK